MELKDLVGGHLLDAVDFSNEQVKNLGDEYSSCQTIRFRLDGTVYVAVEDPGDGYRSCMKSLIVAEDIVPLNTFSPVLVIGMHRGESSSRYDHAHDILELVDAETLCLVLEVGTENTDDYYPIFVASFHPEAMTLND